MIFLLLFLSIFGIFRNCESRGNIATYVGQTYWSHTKQTNDGTNLKLSELVDLKLRNTKTDLFNLGIAESNKTIYVIGERVFRDNVSKFCSELIEQYIFTTSQDFRDAIHFKPFATLSPPISNITINFPTRWIRHYSNTGFQKSPTVFVCYEGDSFLRIEKVQPALKQLWQVKQNTCFSIRNHYNEKCRVREILMFLDGNWHNHNLLPQSSKAIAKIDFQYTLKRKVFTQKCDSQMSELQECCLLEETVERYGKQFILNRCAGTASVNAQIASFMPIKYETFLKYTDFGRRFVNSKLRVCRALEHKPVIYEKSEGDYEVSTDLNATKCAVVY